MPTTNVRWHIRQSHGGKASAVRRHKRRLSMLHESVITTDTDQWGRDRRYTSPEVHDDTDHYDQNRREWVRHHHFPLYVTVGMRTREYLGPEEGGAYGDVVEPEEGMSYRVHDENELRKVVSELKHKPELGHREGEPISNVGARHYEIHITDQPYKGYSPYPYHYE